MEAFLVVEEPTSLALQSGGQFTHHERMLPTSLAQHFIHQPTKLGAFALEQLLKEAPELIF
jgi:hypothetical protein